MLSASPTPDPYRRCSLFLRDLPDGKISVPLTVGLKDFKIEVLPGADVLGQRSDDTYYAEPLYLGCLSECAVIGKSRFVKDQNGSVIDDSRYLIEREELSLEGESELDVKPRGLLILNASKSNYYHWNIDCLPSLLICFMLSLDYNWPIVTDNLLDFQKESLQLMGLNTWPRIELPERGMKFENLLFSSWLGQKVPGLVRVSPFADLVFSRIREHPEVLKAANLASYGKLLYVSRSDAAYRRVAGENSLRDHLIALGFQIIVPGSLTYTQQVAAFAKAEIIVGPHGAGLTNLVFAPRGVTLLEFFSPLYGSECFKRLIQIRQGCYHKMIFPATGPMEQDIEADVDLISDFVKELIYTKSIGS